MASATVAETLVGHLDAVAYPQLIDLILSASPLEVLLTFRSASHALKNGVDPLINRNKAVWSISEEMDGDGVKYADFEFLNREEYRQKVGDKKFVLETMA